MLIQYLKDYRAQRNFNNLVEKIREEKYQLVIDTLSKRKCLSQYWEFYFLNSWAHNCLKNNVEALDQVNIGIQNFQNQGFLYNQKSYILYDFGDYKNALLYAQTASRYLPEDPEVLNNLGYILIRLERFKESIEILDTSIKRDQNYAFAYNNRGFAKFRSGDIDEGLSDIEKSLAIDPSNSYGYKNKAKVLIHQNKINEAPENLNLALQLGYDDLYDDEVRELIKTYSEN